jgi:CRP/FNR family transcriptional regulator, cyclic AMP receptor protein
VNGMAIPVDPHFQFILKIRDLIREESQRSHTIKVPTRAFVYTSGGRDALVYFVESGQIKLVLTTPEGREYVLAIRNAGDIFGELCLSGDLIRAETAVAMEDTRLSAIYYQDLLNLLKGQSLLEGLIRYLACCNARQQDTIGSLLAINSEQRLAKVLLQLGSNGGANHSQGGAVVPRILHEDLAAMVGTTRSRVGFFLKNFRERGLVAVNADRSLTIAVEKLEVFAGKSLPREDAKADPYKNGRTQRTSSFPQLVVFD